MAETGLQSAGDVAIAFHSRPGVLRFAELSGAASWAVSTVDTNVGQSCSLIFRFNQPAIAYNSGSSLRYAIRRGSPAWHIVEVAQLSEAIASGGISLALDPSSHPPNSPGFRASISTYNAAKGIGFFRAGPNTSVWVGQAVDTTAKVCYFNSLAFNPYSQLPAVAYDAQDNNKKSIIKYAFFDGSKWQHEVVGPGAGWCSLAYTPSGQPAIAFMDGAYPHYEVVYAQYTGTSWSLQTVADFADSPWLAFTPAGEPAVSYRDSGADTIKYAVFRNGWTHYEVERSGKDAAGVMHGDFTLTSLAFNPVTGQPAIAYYDHEQGAVRCAVGTVRSIVFP